MCIVVNSISLCDDGHVCMRPSSLGFPEALRAPKLHHACRKVPFDDELVEGGPLIFHAELRAQAECQVLYIPHGLRFKSSLQGLMSTRTQALSGACVVGVGTTSVQALHVFHSVQGEWVTCAIQLRISPEDLSGGCLAGLAKVCPEVVLNHQLFVVLGSFQDMGLKPECSSKQSTCIIP